MRTRRSATFAEPRASTSSSSSSSPKASTSRTERQLRGRGEKFSRNKKCEKAEDNPMTGEKVQGQGMCEMAEKAERHEVDNLMDEDKPLFEVKIDTKNHCIFCYKECVVPEGSSSDGGVSNVTVTEENDGSCDTTRQEVCARYMKLVSRYLELGNLSENAQNQRDPQRLDIENGNVQITACEACYVIINLFCTLYQEFSTLKMRLDWTVSRMRNVMKCADKVPSRVADFNRKVLEGEHGMQRDVKELMEKFRSEFIGKSSQMSVPLILLPRADQLGGTYSEEVAAYCVGVVRSLRIDPPEGTNTVEESVSKNHEPRSETNDNSRSTDAANMNDIDLQLDNELRLRSSEANLTDSPTSQERQGNNTSSNNLPRLDAPSTSSSTTEPVERRGSKRPKKSSGTQKRKIYKGAPTPVARLQVPEIPEPRVEVQLPEVPRTRVEVQVPEVPPARVEVQLPEIPQTRVEVQVSEVPQARVEVQLPEIPQARVEVHLPEILETAVVPVQITPAQKPVVQELIDLTLEEDDNNKDYHSPLTASNDAQAPSTSQNMQFPHSCTGNVNQQDDNYHSPLTASNDAQAPSTSQNMQFPHSCTGNVNQQDDNYHSPLTASNDAQAPSTSQNMHFPHSCTGNVNQQEQSRFQFPNGIPFQSNGPSQQERPRSQYVNNYQQDNVYFETHHEFVPAHQPHVTHFNVGYTNQQYGYPSTINVSCSVPTATATYAADTQMYGVQMNLGNGAYVQNTYEAFYNHPPHCSFVHTPHSSSSHPEQFVAGINYGNTMYGDGFVYGHANHTSNTEPPQQPFVTEADDDEYDDAAGSMGSGTENYASSEDQDEGVTITEVDDDEEESLESNQILNNVSVVVDYRHQDIDNQNHGEIENLNHFQAHLCA